MLNKQGKWYIFKTRPDTNKTFHHAQYTIKNLTVFTVISIQMYISTVVNLSK